MSQYTHDNRVTMVGPVEITKIGSLRPSEQIRVIALQQANFLNAHWSLRQTDSDGVLDMAKKFEEYITGLHTEEATQRG